MVNTTLKLTNAQNAAALDYSTKTTYIAVGDDNTTPLVGDTTLGNETVRDAITASGIASNIVTYDLRLDVTENNGNTQEEIGSLDAASSGNLYDHSLVTSFAKTSSKEVFYRIKTTFTAVEG